MSVKLSENMQRSGALGKISKKDQGKEDYVSGATAVGKSNERRRAPKIPKHELSSGLPVNWPNSTAEELALRPVRHIEVGSPQTFAYCNNFIKTSQYEFWNFLPKVLLEQFDPRSKIANVYFLLIAVLQCIPQITTTQGVPTTLIPLTALILVDGFFLFLEDIKRHISDRAANATKISRYNPERVQFEVSKWKDLEVGDFVQIGTRETVPADVVLISVSEKGDIPTGKCFVETKSLDGETSLKARQALPATYHTVTTVRALDRVRGSVSMEHPNRSIHSFQGVFEMEKSDEGKSKTTCEISKENLLLRGSVVRNCDWVIGLVVNTGKDTKILMSMPQRVVKRSELERNMQKEIYKVFILLVIMCLLGAIGDWQWKDYNDFYNVWYMNAPGKTDVVSFLISFAHFLLIHAPLIPVSLYVSIAVARYAQSYFMRQDLEMYYEFEDRPMDVRNMNVNEQLGQISHIVTDKTGTLTCNIMDFRKMSIHGVLYGKGISGIARANWESAGREIPKDILEYEAKAQANAVKHVAFYCPVYEQDMSVQSPQRARVINFFRVLAICHDAEIERDPTIKDDAGRLSASTSDDEALICAADFFGFKFVDRLEGNILKLENRYSRASINTEEIEILHMFEFTVKRKRLSVIAKDILTGAITMYIKGADSVILPLLVPGQNADVVKLTCADRDKFAEDGLRCLFVASRTIKEEDYKAWNRQYNAARIDIRQLERKKKGESNQLDDLLEDLEQGFTLLGCTGIEDRLQFGASDCVEELSAAGINIWMTTGDAQDTAVNCGLAAKVILPAKHSHHCIFDRKEFKTKLEMRNAFKTHINTFDSKLEEDGLQLMVPWYLIIDGATLAIAMEDKVQDGMRQLLAELCLRCRSVISCRVSPSQKRELVMFLSETPGSIVLAVGDGANDVAMIRSAHVGVGLIGQEGEQAAICADYSISQFRYLSPLILKHGQCNYTRLSNLICYVFYKNLLLSLAMYWFNLNNGFSGQSIFTDGAIQMYNLFYTSLPILYYAAHDMSFSAVTFYRFPQTYRACISGKYFNTKVFWTWMATALLESLILGVLPLYMLQGFDKQFGLLSSFWQAGVLSMSGIAFCVNTKIFFIQTKFHWSHYLLISVGVLFWIISVAVISSEMTFDYNLYGVFSFLLGSPNFWLGLLLVVTFVVARDLYSCAVYRHFNFEPLHIVQEADAKHQLKKQRNKQSGAVASSASGKRPSDSSEREVEMINADVEGGQHAASQPLTGNALSHGLSKGKVEMPLRFTAPKRLA